MRVVSLASSSSGNSLLIEAGPRGRTKLLIDVGLSLRQLVQRLRSHNVRPEQLQGVLITHEHSDHVRGLPSLLTRYGVSAITDPRTYQAVVASIAAGCWSTDSGNFKEIESLDGAPTDFFESPLTDDAPLQALPAGSHRVIGDIEVTSFPIPHDAVAPCGYLLRAGGCRVCVVTDCGSVTPTMLEAIRHADLLVLEANHDRERLIRGPYPRMLKARILGPNGHLSNDQTAEAVLHTWRFDSVRWLWLAHLSRTNNTPTLALEGIRGSLRKAGADLAQIHISALPPDIGPTWDSTRLWQATDLWKTRA